MKKIVTFILTVVISLVPIMAVSGSQQSEAEKDITAKSETAETETAKGITAETRFETLDNHAFNYLRSYYNDETLSEEDLFDRFVKLKKSYIKALDNLYTANTLAVDSKSEETAMHIFYEGQETLFGLDSSVYLYNIAIYRELEKSEQTFLDLIIPVRSTNSVVTISMMIPQEQLGENTSSGVAAILSNIAYDGLTQQQKAPAIFNDTSLMEMVKAGIYPAAHQESPDYVKITDSLAGYSVSLPTSYVPFIQNKLGGILTYTGYKIDPHKILSISSAPPYDQTEGTSAAIERFKATAPGTVVILESGDYVYGSNDFKYIFYSDIENDVQKYFYDYYIQGSTRLYKIQLQGEFSEPGPIILRQLDKILAGFHADKAAKISTNSMLWSDPTAVLYENREEGYSFKYPSAWTLEDASPNIDYDHLQLSIPGYSGALEISIQESGTEAFQKSGTEAFEKTCMPCSGKISKLLFSDFIIDGSVKTIYRLTAFVDENGRNRLCYSSNILKGEKVYSMFIVSGEYMTKDGIFSDDKINRMINMVASSFCALDTPESEARALTGETRNRKLTFVENELTNVYGPGLIVLPAENTQPDGTTIVSVENTGDSGYYKIRLDYANKQVEVLERVLKRDILLGELKRLSEEFDGFTITATYRNEANMTVSIKCISGKNEGTDNNDATSNNQETVIHTYAVNVKLVNGKVTWNTVKVADQEDYINECKAFVKSKFSTDVDVHVFCNNAFNNVDVYLQNGVDYRVMAYYQGGGRSGFFMLSMNPVTGEFTARKSFIPFAHTI